MFIITSARFLKIFTRGFARAITLYPFIIVNNYTLKSDVVLINHEKIHIRQQLELLVLFFYILYLVEYALYRWRGMNHTNAYYNISLEKEAYANEKDEDYLKHRKLWAFRFYR